MEYTQLVNSKFGWESSKMVSVTKNLIYFSSKFREKYQVLKYITIYKDVHSFICFKFSDECKPGSYSVTMTKKGGYFLRIPTFLTNGKLPCGKYNITVKDGYYVTDCKLND